MKEHLLNIFAAGFVGEEFSGISEEYTWVVDPIDGTTNLVHGYNHSAISVALTHNGAPVVGVVQNIFTGETFAAAHGHGAHFRGTKKLRKLMHVSEVSELEAALLSFGLPYDKTLGARIFQAAHNLFDRVRDLRRSGSAALDICYVAQGRCDAHFELGLKPWDLAAACLILREAGGAFCNWDGTPINNFEAASYDIICHNNHIGDKIIAAIH